MNQYSYFRENFKMLTQFVAAFDDCFLYRYDKEGVPKEKISVRYVMGPKQRVMYDIVNPAKNITLPVIAMEQTNLRRDSSRIQNKDYAMYKPYLNSKGIVKVPQPVPITFDVDVSIVVNYKEDMDQIISNFVPWCNPYFIISWRVPEEFRGDFVDEIRSEVSWSGEISYENPIELNGDEKFKYVASTSFTVKGWLFPSLETPEKPIYVINSTFIASGTGDDFRYRESYNALSGIDYTTTDVILISAYPEITNEFHNGKPYRETITIDSDYDHTITLYGKRFGFNNFWYLSSNTVLPLQLEEINTFRFPTISAYRVPDELIEVVSDNIATVSLTSNWLSSGNFTIVTANSAGWVSSENQIVVI